MVKKADKSDLTRALDQSRVVPTEREQFEMDARDAAKVMTGTALGRVDGDEDKVDREELSLVLDVLFGEDIEYCAKEKPDKPEVERGHSGIPRRRPI